MSQSKQPSPPDRRGDRAAGGRSVKPTRQVDDNKDDLGHDINSRSDTHNPVNEGEPRRQP